MKKFSLILKKLKYIQCKITVKRLKLGKLPSSFFDCTHKSRSKKAYKKVIDCTQGADLD